MLSGMCATWLHFGAMTGSRFVDVTPWPGGEWEAYLLSFVEGELSFLGSVLVGLSGSVSNFS